MEMRYSAWTRGCEQQVT